MAKGFALPAALAIMVAFLAVLAAAEAARDVPKEATLINPKAAGPTPAPMKDGKNFVAFGGVGGIAGMGGVVGVIPIGGLGGSGLGGMPGGLGGSPGGLGGDPGICRTHGGLAGAVGRRAPPVVPGIP